MRVGHRRFWDGTSPISVRSSLNLGKEVGVKIFLFVFEKYQRLNKQKVSREYSVTE